MGNQGIYNDSCKSTPGDDTQHEAELDKIEANVFFDGTLNNYYNTEKASAELRQQYGGEDTSYDNALSNIARMWSGLGEELDSPDPAVYVQGIGTTAYQSDSTGGYAFGMGDTGIEDRVDEAFAPLKDKVKAKRGGKGLPALLEINVFGFSRGAAAARLFVFKASDPQERQKYFTDKWSPVLVRINFVGLFDTVSSHGYSLTRSYENDRAELHLAMNNSDVKHVFHLRALDEYRLNFSLTTIQSNVAGGKGHELAIPGSHSDVGGGYKDDDKEVRQLTATYQKHTESGEQTVPGTRDFVYAQGWYQPSEADPPRWWEQTNPTHRRTVQGDYYRVALSLMVDQAKKHTTANYPDALSELSKHPKIKKVQEALLAFAQSKCNTCWALDEQLGAAEAKAFRHQHLHHSCKEENLKELKRANADAPRFADDTTLTRLVHEA